MFTSYLEAAQSKLCPAILLREEVKVGRLRGDDVFVVWDDAFRDWIPEIPLQRMVQNLNQRRFDSRAIYKPITSKPVSEVHEIASRTRREVEAANWWVAPITNTNLELMFGSQDGYWDAQPYCIEALEEYEDWLNEGKYLFQIRIGLSPGDYAGKNLYASELRTILSICGTTRATEEQVFAAITEGDLKSLSYRGDQIVILDKQYELWESRIALGVAPQDCDETTGHLYEKGFWPSESE